jgi:hypothetical protein
MHLPEPIFGVECLAGGMAERSGSPSCRLSRWQRDIETELLAREVEAARLRSGESRATQGACFTDEPLPIDPLNRNSHKTPGFGAPDISLGHRTIHIVDEVFVNGG